MRTEQPRFYHPDQFRAQPSCLHCGGILRHERWCVRRNPRVRYAYQVVLGATQLSAEDQLILHALGVEWGGTGTSIPRIDAFHK